MEKKYTNFFKGLGRLSLVFFVSTVLAKGLDKADDSFIHDFYKNYKKELLEKKAFRNSVLNEVKNTENLKPYHCFFGSGYYIDLDKDGNADAIYYAPAIPSRHYSLTEPVIKNIQLQ